MVPALLKAAALKDDVELQPHQKRVEEEARKGPLRKLLYHSLGSGKSLSGIAAAEAAGEPYTAIAPASLRQNYIGERAKFTDGKTPADVISYSALAAGGPPPKDHTLIFDECLPLGTLVDGRPVESIRPGDLVVSFNHQRGCVEPRLVTRTAQRLTDTIVVLRFDNGESIACTPNHPVYTYRGYVPAEDVSAGDCVYRTEVRRAPKDPDGLSALPEAVRGVRLPLSCAGSLLGRVSAGSLGGGLREVEPVAAGGDTSAHEATQSDAECRDAQEGERDYEAVGAPAEDSRRQWHRADAAGGRIVGGAGLADERGGRGRSRLLEAGDAPQLPSRCGELVAAGRRRGGRAVAQGPAAAGFGRQEDGVLAVHRVEGVEVHQRGSGPEFERLCPGGVVCDLTVDGNHNFFAAGYLVHNSQQLRNPDSARTQQAIAAADRAKQVLMLSGSPLVNRPGELAVPLRMLTGEQMTPDEFEARYVTVKTKYPSLFHRLVGWKGKQELDVNRPEELKGKLRGHVDYHNPGKPVVPTSHEDVHVEMGPEQARLYDAMWDKLPWYVKWKLRNEVALTDDELRRMTSFLTGPRQVGLSTYPYQANPDPYKAFEQSPKLVEAARRMQEHLKDPRAKALVFSNFIGAGLTPYAEALRRAGIPHGVFHGGMNDKERKQLVDDYNANKLRVALLGPSGTEGLSFKGTQLIHLLDPHYHGVRSDQSVGRGLRYDSHFGLPEELQHVKVQRFLSRLPKGLLDRMLSGVGFDRTHTTLATDDHLAAIARRKEDLNRRFLELLREVGTEGK